MPQDLGGFPGPSHTRKEDDVKPEEQERVLGPLRSSEAPSYPFPEASAHPSACPWLHLPLPPGPGGSAGSPSLPASSMVPAIAASFLWRLVPHPAATLLSLAHITIYFISLP